MMRAVYSSPTNHDVPVSTTLQSASSKGEAPSLAVRTCDAIRSEPSPEAEAVLLTEKMLDRGELFRHLQSNDSERADGQFRFADSPHVSGNKMNILSARNMYRLETALGPLSPIETTFLTAALTEPWYLTHATTKVHLLEMIGPDEVLTLRSYHQLFETGKLSFWNANSNFKDDLELLQGLDFVYTGIEIGTGLKKTFSRFGAKLVRFFLDDALERRVLCLPDDQKKSVRTVSTKMMEEIGVGDIPLSVWDLAREKFSNEMFSGCHIKRGLVLRAIQVFRTAGITPFLRRTDPVAMNAVINGFGRPQILIPRMVHLPKKCYTVHTRKNHQFQSTPDDVTYDISRTRQSSRFEYCA